MNVELGDDEKQPYSDSQCDTDVGRLKKALSDKARVILVKTITNNFILTPVQAVRFLEEVREWPNILNLTLLLSYKVAEDARDEFCQKVMENKKICRFPEDKEKLQMFLEYEFQQKEKKKEEGPVISGSEGKDDPVYKWVDI